MRYNDDVCYLEKTITIPFRNNVQLGISMTSGIFLIQGDKKLVRMNEAAYDSEDLLQSFLVDYPDLLAGDQMESSDPRRWLLVRREMAVPGELDGGGRWSVDHLFLDQDAVPTLVEVKRSTDTRIRREVVGQMLDYAANAVAYWPVEHLRSQFVRQCDLRQMDSDEVLAEFLGDDERSEEFWQKAKTNLQAGKIRMVFVADEIPNELKRVVEFLNEQMDPAQVLAVEIKQFVGEGLQSLVPRVIGQTAEAEKRKGTSRETGKWDEESFFAELKSRKGEPQAIVARKLYDWCRTKTNDFSWGRGNQEGSVYPVFDETQKNQRLFGLRTSGFITFPFNIMQSSTAFSDRGAREQLLNRLNEIEGVNLPETAIERWPSISMSNLTTTDNLDKFLKTEEWAVEKIQAREHR